MRTTTPLVSLLVSAGLALGACGADDSSSSPASTTATTAATTGATTDPSTSSSGQVSANDASRDEIAAALTAAGVDNADRWAGEVVEYRPYSADGEGRLREELAKYGPSEATIDQIIGVLTFP